MKMIRNLFRKPSLRPAWLAAVAFLLAACPATASWNLTTLVNFPQYDTNGYLPDDGVVLDSAGNLYGTTVRGGANNEGTVYEVVKGRGTVSALASVLSSPGTAGPSNLTIDANGNLFGTTAGGGPKNFGQVFEVAKGSKNFTPLVSFIGPNGAGPSGGLALDTNGNLYGTTVGGGAGNAGTVFEITKNGTFSTLASFNRGSGYGPVGTLAIDSAGNILGIANDTGPGAVFELAKGSNTPTFLAPLHAFTGGYSPSPESGVVLDAAGNLYGFLSLSSAGPNPTSTVFEVAKGSSTAVSLASIRSLTIGGLTLDANGDLFGTTYNGGTHGDGSVFEIPKGGTLVTLFSFNGTDGSNPMGALALDASGNLYGTTYTGGTGSSGTVFELSTTAVPEPSSGLLLGLGFALAIRSAWHRRAS